MVPSLKLSSGALVELVRPEELVRRVKMTARVPPPQRDSDKLVKLIGIQNNLETKNWIVHIAKVLESKHTLLCLGWILFRLELKSKNYRVHLETAEVVFKTTSKN